MGIFSGLRKIADKALKKIPGVNIAYGIADSIAEETGFTKKLNSITDPQSFAPPIKLGLPSGSNTPFVKPPHTIQATYHDPNQPFWDRVKNWFIYKWYTAKGMLIGVIIGVLLLLGFMYGFIPNPFGGRRRR